MKRFFAIILLSVLFCASAFAYDFSAVCESGQTLYYNITSNVEPYTVEVTFEIDGTEWNYIFYSDFLTGDLVIPESVTNNDTTYSVTSIGNYAFYNCSLTSVSIPNSVTSIGHYAFYYCGSITSLTIPNSVSSIGEYAFFGWQNISSITIPSSVTSIGCFAFHGYNRHLESIVVESGNSTYDSRNDCNAIIETSTNKLIRGCKNSFIPNTISIIDDFAFSACFDLDSIIIPNSVESIGKNAFKYCYTLSSITIPNSVTTIGDSAFYSCSGMTSVAIGDSVVWIGQMAFLACHNLEDIAVNTGNLKYDSRNSCNAIIETSTNKLIYGCKNTVIPNTVTEIECFAFYMCLRLKSITIPNSVTRIGGYAFFNCQDLDTIISYAIEPPTIYPETFKYDDLSIPLIVPCGSASAYSNAEYWRYFTNIQEDCSGVEENEISDLQIYPNPVGNILNITSSEEISSVEIVNTLGQVVLQMDVDGESAVCDVENLPSGVYVVKVRALRQAQGATLRKFVKE